MRYLTAVIMMVLRRQHLTSANLQVELCGANYIGDVGNTTYISPELAIGGIVKWNRSESIYLEPHLHRLSADDADSDEARRNQRG